MRKFSHWSIRYKLLSLLLLLGVTTFAVTGTIAYVKYLDALKNDVMNQLTGTTRAKQFQIDYYYQTIHNHAETLSDDRMFIDAMREFRTAYRKMDTAPIRPRPWMRCAKITSRTFIQKCRSSRWPGGASRIICPLLPPLFSFNTSIS